MPEEDTKLLFEDGDTTVRLLPSEKDDCTVFYVTYDPTQWSPFLFFEGDTDPDELVINLADLDQFAVPQR